MPQQRFPIYPRKPHKNGQQARIRLDGRQVYLGRHGSRESLNRYELLRMEWLKGKSVDPATMTIDELSIKFLEHARGYYVKNGVETDEVACIRAALRYVVRLFGPTLAADFGPQRLKSTRRAMVAAGLARSTVNDQVKRIRRMFSWATEEEMILGSICHALREVKPLMAGRTSAREPEPVQSAPAEFVEAVRPFVSREVWMMVQVQLQSGCRPGEVVQMRRCDIDMTRKVWEYRPQSHKMQHKKKNRVIFLGTKSQDLLLDFLNADASAYLFSPARAQSERNAARRAARQSPMTPSQAARQAKQDGRRRPGDCYSADSYRRCISRACTLAGVPVWRPNQLRHAFATWLKNTTKDENTVRLMLGHSDVETTRRYLDKDEDADLENARKFAAEVG